MITIGIIVVLLIVVSRSIKQRSIRLERLFILNLRSRDIAAQVHGKKRPLYEGKLLDRDVHIAVFDIPMDTQWMGSSLKQLNLGKKYGIHITSILRANHRLNIPDGEYVLFPGDKLEVIGSDEQLAKFQQAVESEVFGQSTDRQEPHGEPHPRQVQLYGYRIGRRKRESFALQSTTQVPRGRHCLGCRRGRVAGSPICRSGLTHQYHCTALE